MRLTPQSTKTVACFDIATKTGVCCGHPGDRRPFVVTWDLGAVGTNRPRRLAYFADLLDEFFRQNAIDAAYYEAPLPIAGMNRLGTTEDVMLLLRGSIGVFEARAAHAGIETIGSFDVKSARKHFIGSRTMPRGRDGRSEAKKAVMKMCATLGIEVADDNSADAVAGWAYCCGLINPRIAHLVTPLFRER